MENSNNQVSKKKPRRANGQGSVYKSEKRNRWVALAFDIHGKRHTRIFKLRSDAENWIHQQRIARQLGNSTYALNAKATVGEFLSAWLEQYKGNIRPSTYRNYKGAINSRIAPYIGELNASKLQPQSIESLYGTLREQGYRAGSIKNVHRVLSAAYKHAVRMDAMPRNPLDKVKMPKIESTPTKPIPLEHFKSILINAASNPYLHARFVIGMCVGLRPGESCGLKWSDIDWQQKTLTIERQVLRVTGQGLDFHPVKQGGVRTIPLADNWILALQEHKHFQDLERPKWRRDFGVIFPNSDGGLLDAKRDWKLWSDFLKKNGLPHYQLLQMRKTAFSFMARKTDPKTLMEFSGHTQLSTLLKSYVFSSSDSLHEAVDVINELYPAEALSRRIPEASIQDPLEELFLKSSE